MDTLTKYHGVYHGMAKYDCYVMEMNGTRDNRMAKSWWCMGLQIQEANA
jgi:hypothetical protein